jgi:outer membrane protein assembly factor BamB
MTPESLEDHLRKATRHFTARLPEEQVFTLGRDLARELARLHAESPPRHPEIDPATIGFVDGKPVLGGGETTGDVAEDLLQLGALLQWLATAAPADVSWRLDGPPPADLSSLDRRAALAGLLSPRPDARYPSAAAAAEAFEAALNTTADTAVSWPLFRGDAARSGQRPTPAPLTGLLPAWDLPVGAVIASPILTARLVIAATTDGRLHFLERSTGRRVHEVKVASALESSPALAGFLLHLGTDDGELLGIDVRDGKEAYRYKAGALVRSSPLVHEGRVYAGVVDTKEAGALVALDALTGKLVWRRKLGAVFASPTLAGARILVGSDDGALHAIDLEGGALAWSSRLGGRVRATAAVGRTLRGQGGAGQAGEIAVVADFEGRVAAIRTADGSQAWMRELGQPVYSSACITGGLAVVGCHDGSVQGLSLAIGEPAFRVETRGPVVSSPVALGDRCLIASTDGDLYLLDPGGQVLARVPVAREGVQSSPAVDDAMLVLGSGRGLHAFRIVR